MDMKGDIYNKITLSQISHQNETLINMLLLKVLHCI